MWFSSLKTMFSCSAHTAPTLACIADGIETLPRSILTLFQHLTFLVIGDFFILPCFFQTTRGFLGDSIEWLSNKDFLDAGDPRAHLPDWPLSNQCHLCHFSQVIVIFIGPMCTWGPIYLSMSVYLWLKPCEDLVKTVNLVNVVKT